MRSSQDVAPPAPSAPANGCSLPPGGARGCAADALRRPPPLSGVKTEEEARAKTLTEQAAPPPPPPPSPRAANPAGGAGTQGSRPRESAPPRSYLLQSDPLGGGGAWSWAAAVAPAAGQPRAPALAASQPMPAVPAPATGPSPRTKFELQRSALGRNQVSTTASTARASTPLERSELWTYLHGF